MKITIGKEFYYADRERKIPVKCKIVGTGLGFPQSLFAEEIETGTFFTCYVGFGCYDLNEYDKALKDAQVAAERRIL